MATAVTPGALVAAATAIVLGTTVVLTMAVILTTAVAALFPTSAAAQSGVSVAGQVVDLETREPVEDAVVAIGAVGARSTDERGFFQFADVPAGEWTLTVRHVAYGEHERAIQVRGAPLRLTVEVTEQEIRLEPLVVEAMSRGEQERRGAGRQLNRITRDEIRRYESTAVTLVELITGRVPGVHITRSGVVGQPTCLEFRGARSGNFVRGLGSTDPGCNSPEVYLDGVLVSNPSSLYATLPIATIENIEVVQPSEAGARYGIGSMWGALIIETRRPGRRPGESLGSGLLGPVRHDWELEGSPHRTGRVFLAAAAGNALGLAAGVAVASRCIGFRGIDNDAIVSDCSATATMAAGAVAVGLPALGSALGARFAGATDRSRGTMGAALIGAAVTLIPGYALGIAGQRDDAGPAEGAGVVVLTLAAPLVTTVADRLFRRVFDEP